MTVCLLMVATTAFGVNTSKSVEQVTGLVTLTDDVDYCVTGATPFTDDGIVNIENTEHAVLILLDVKPSKAKSLLAKHVLISGEKAVNGQNCQLKMYNRGCIIMPYSRDLKPLTVYSEPNFQGEACSDFGLESTNGFMNTLSDKQLNNRIRSFKLKRGHASAPFPNVTVGGEPHRSVDGFRCSMPIIAKARPGIKSFLS